MASPTVNVAELYAVQPALAAYTAIVTVMAFVAPPLAVTATVYWVEDNAAVGVPEISPPINTRNGETT